MNLSLTPRHKRYIADKVKSGAYASGEEVVREGLRLLEAAGGVKKSRPAKAPRAGPRRARFAAPPAFVELMTTPAAGLAECVIEFEGRRGEMRIDTREAVICPASLASILTCSAT